MKVCTLIEKGPYGNYLVWLIDWLIDCLIDGFWECRSWGNHRALEAGLAGFSAPGICIPL